MMNSGLAKVFVLLIMGLIAAFGYYQGFMALISRQLNTRRKLGSRKVILMSLLYLAGAISASAVAVLFYFSQSS